MDLLVNDQKTLGENGELINSQSTADSNFMQIFNPSILYSKSNSFSIWTLFHEILEDKKDYIDQTAVLQRFNQETQSLHIGDQPASSLQELVSQLQRDCKYYLFDVLARLILKEILSQDRFVQNFQKIFKYSKDKWLYFDTFSFSSFFACCRIAVDSELGFSLRKLYSPSADASAIEREWRLFECEYSKFIVSSLEIDEDERAARLPLFPLGTLADLLRYYSKGEIELTFVDRVVILLEVATALADLHARGGYHGSLSSESVYLTAAKDACLASFCHDESLMREVATPRGAWYTRAPEFYDKMEYFDTLDDGCTEKVRFNQLLDIFAFGAVAHEAVTMTPLKGRMRRRSAHENFRIIRGDYCKFLLSCDDSELFFGGSLQCDSRGECAIGARDVIEGCMRRSPEERFSSMEKVIAAIKELPVYMRNKEEIEFRISSAPDARDCQCTLADVAEGCLRGGHPARECMDSLLSVYRDAASCGDDASAALSNCVIKDVIGCFGANSDKSDK